ncbi:hypothetical protein [Companilactobacillus mishanensis]|uniref:Uncharacterized protein n=1 Tax=Companilactobacillus mishanensis TaxID=2486008 RepID=A0ABW9P5T1_9LACO|nr:hypothetical protein [Companilactobacillus mishanensis]MQS44585.1 hypothetical protein [Companilactobacillus mishanensis]
MCRIKLVIDNVEFEIEGPQEFVDKKVQDFLETLPKINRVPVVHEVATKNDTSQKVISPNEKKTKYKNEFLSKKLLYDDDGVLTPTFYIPGKGKADKTRNCAILMAYFEDDVSSEDIKSILIKQAAFDQNNFYKILKRSNPNLIIKNGGDKHLLNISVTTIGEKNAIEMIKSIKSGMAGDSEISLEI